VSHEKIDVSSSSFALFYFVVCIEDGIEDGGSRGVAMAEKNRILIVDDNQANCELLDAYLAGVDCEIAFAADGKEALAKVAEFKPDLILLDVMMPKLSGFEVCKRIKQDPALQRIMVLMVTALNELGDIERAVEAGTNDFLSKPINKLELTKRVENLLRLKDISDENERLRRYIQGMEDDRTPPGNGEEPKPPGSKN
jgi:CheY-like chemotaxis protein